MAIQSKFDFVGGYEEDVKGGLLHVADHHVSPGKKQWTWGNGDFGRAWDRNLTAEDGPYIELMTGMYTDNQPDFTWLQPYEEKSWKQYFMPYAEVGYVKNATKDALLNMEVKEGKGKVILYTTGVNKDVHVFVKDNVNGGTLFDKVISISPAEPFQAEFAAEGLKAEDRPRPPKTRRTSRPSNSSTSRDSIWSNTATRLTTRWTTMRRRCAANRATCVATTPWVCS